MNTWKVILATVVIFGAGVMTGGLLVRITRPSVAPAPAPIPQRLEMVRRLTHDLDLTPEQRQRIDHALRESQERIRILWELEEPERREEFKKVRDDIHSILTPEQAKRFDALFRERQRLLQQKSQSGFRANQLPPRPFPPRPGDGSRGPQFNRPPPEEQRNPPQDRQRAPAENR